MCAEAQNGVSGIGMFRPQDPMLPILNSEMGEMEVIELALVKIIYTFIYNFFVLMLTSNVLFSVCGSF